MHVLHSTFLSRTKSRPKMGMWCSAVLHISLLGNVLGLMWVQSLSLFCPVEVLWKPRRSVCLSAVMISNFPSQSLHLYITTNNQSIYIRFVLFFIVFYCFLLFFVCCLFVCFVCWLVYILRFNLFLVVFFYFSLQDLAVRASESYGITLKVMSYNKLSEDRKSA